MLGKPGAELDAAGGLIAPGFVDAHVHLGLAALDALRCDLSTATSVAELAARVRAFAASSDADWIIGGG